MKTIFDVTTQQEIITRINSLTPGHKALWGKMNVYQMVKHGYLCDDMYHGTLPIKRVFIGRLIGKRVLKKFIKDATPFTKNSPTSEKLKIAETAGDLEREKQLWAGRIQQYNQFNNPHFVHPFFGPMTKEEIGLVAYKHADHHLRQFGA